MPSVPEPRDHAEHHASPCLRHHVWMPHCPACRAWHRDLLRDQRDQADRLHKATT